MPLFGQSQIKKYSPKTVKFTDVYRDTTKSKKLGETDLKNAQSALSSAGYGEKDTKEIMKGKEFSITEAKQVAKEMNKAGLKGFNLSGRKTIDKYVRKQAIKKMNLAGRRRELMQESLQEDIYKAKTHGTGRVSSAPKTSKKKPGGGMRLGF